MLEALPITGVDGYELLREAVVIQATDDLRRLRDGRKVACSYMSELRNFFYGEWGCALLGNLDGELIYKRIMQGG
jgi:hypothetical protein